MIGLGRAHTVLQREDGANDAAAVSTWSSLMGTDEWMVVDSVIDRCDGVREGGGDQTPGLGG